VFTHAIFGAIFVALSNATFVASVTSGDFAVIQGAMFAAISKLHHVRNMGDFAATNRTEIAMKSSLVYTRDVMMQLECNGTCIEKCDKSCIKNPMCKRAFKRESGFAIRMYHRNVYKISILL